MTLEEFNKAVTPKMRKAYQKNGLSLEQAVILASMVEKEAILSKEGPIIASVFYNRLAAGMKLESDPTVQYAIGYIQRSETWWKNPLSLSDLQIDSGYNTYQNSGLPPAPICNPGIICSQFGCFSCEHELLLLQGSVRFIWKTQFLYYI